MGIRPWVFNTVIWVCRICLTPFFQLRARGLENLPSDKGFILLPKHRRWEDIPLLSMAASRPLYYVAKYELFHYPIANWLLQSLGGIPLNRSRPLQSRASIKAVLSVLGEGQGVVVFPEGTYFRNRMGPGKVGMVKFILSNLSMPFVPVGINYRKAGLRTCVEIHFGGVCYAEPNMPSSRFLKIMMKEIARLSNL